jgi:hypothetical protein
MARKDEGKIRKIKKPPILWGILVYRNINSFVSGFQSAVNGLL